MNPISVQTTIARPREQVFEYLADIANHAEFCDHFMVDWHLTREESYGVGAGVRFKVPSPMNRFPWGDATIVEAQPPYRIVEAGRGGKFNRLRTLGIYTLEEGPGGTTRVTYSFELATKTLSDRLLTSLGSRGWLKRRLRKAMRRLRSILEDGEGRGARVTIAGGARKPASAYRHGSLTGSGR